MAKDFKFPDPADYPPKHPVVICPAERVLNLYNQAHPNEPAQRTSKTVKEWFSTTATNEGWDGVHFLPEVQTSHSAGAVLLSPHGQKQMMPVANALLNQVDVPGEDNVRPE